MAIYILILLAGLGIWLFIENKQDKKTKQSKKKSVNKKRSTSQVKAKREVNNDK